ncbi:ATP-binding cassette domain-containing protein [Metabacillus arenae]|uniref:Carnitine transport ATP-binding protein OpuCA n=1 Tax=Metabacillus arenae TaxID=2771434 RepID=A0A926NKA8_9BACI|nr:ATP-binding cassette domain-containing protein [Metabacillus arenae]MBD1382168.1 ATP-binding cassette domain-containing protein [Metabacillus arenae]
MTNSFLKVEGVSKHFGQFTALEQISFQMNKNEFVCLLGPSGCGKTTLLRLIAGLDQATKGRIYVNERDITNLPPAKRNFGIVFQSYALFPNLTALKNVEFGLKAKKIPKQQVREKAMEALELVDLLHVMDKHPAQLSGGQQQRVSLARALALSPEFLLLDEPLSALDAKVREKLRYEIRMIQEKTGIPTIMVTHDQEEALTMADKIIVMNNAKIVQTGTPQEVYYQPNHPFVADFIGSINFINKHSNLKDVVAIRPEHIKVTEENGLLSIVETVEFKGPVYRLKVKVVEPTSSLFNELVKVDVSAHIAHRLNIQKGSQLAITLPENRILAYKEQVVV